MDAEIGNGNLGEDPETPGPASEFTHYYGVASRNRGEQDFAELYAARNTVRQNTYGYWLVSADWESVTSGLAMNR